MAGYRDQLTAARPILAGDWLTPKSKSVGLGARLKRVQCKLVLTPKEFSYEESFEGRARELAVSPDESGSLRVELMDRDRYARLVEDGRDTGLRLPVALAARLLLWLGNQPPYNR